MIFNPDALSILVLKGRWQLFFNLNILFVLTAERVDWYGIIRSST